MEFRFFGGWHWIGSHNTVVEEAVECSFVISCILKPHLNAMLFLFLLHLISQNHSIKIRFSIFGKSNLTECTAHAFIGKIQCLWNEYVVYDDDVQKQEATKKPKLWFLLVELGILLVSQSVVPSRSLAFSKFTKVYLFEWLVISSNKTQNHVICRM